MPNIADITVKKADGTTDITYEDVVPSSGGTSPAVWQSTAGSAQAFKPTLKVRSYGDAAGKQRNLEATFTYPQVTTGTDGIDRITQKGKMVLTINKPTEMSDATVDEFIEQGLNLFKSSLFESMAKAGYSAT